MFKLPAERRRLDPLTVAAAFFFVLAVAAAAFPAVRAGISTPGALLVLLGLAAVCFLGLFAFARMEEPAQLLDERAVVDALPEPAAACTADGRLVQINKTWRETVGASRRLSRRTGPLVFATLAAARRGEPASADLPVGEGTRRLCASALGKELILLRLPDRPAAPTREADAAPSEPGVLDAFAAAAPFGAALLDGPDPFAAAVAQANPALEAMTKDRQLLGAAFADLIEPASRAEAAARLKSGRGPVEVRLAADPQRITQLYLSRLDGRVLVYLVDVSEQKQLELQLAQSQKMQAIGQLAGGVAHDFNNLLTAIQLRLDELLHRHPVGDPSYEGLNEIRQTAVRAADLVRKLLAFSRKQTVQRETLELGELISEFEVLLRRLLREDVKLVTDYGRDLPLVRADKGQLEAAVMNLAVNARDAMRAQGGGVVRIRTARLSRAEAMALGYTAAPEGEFALIEVADTGPGIPPELMAKIFEPFFTTKAVGEGTGLGLATVYGIVKQADGWIHVDSKPGEGAAFRVFLPVHHPAPAETAAADAMRAKPRPAPRDLSGAGRILFVEDEDAVRGVAARLLRARGYEVIEAADGEEALGIAEENAGKIDLMISDVIMPGMDGPTLLKKARGYLGAAPVMFISGYAEAEFSDLLEGEQGVSFLAKPIDIKSLAERVKQELAAAA
ncbi:MAG TPA: ATP-binding protein [Caulobacteraceae bacterium]|jgi:two-component system cell cycle sensor histidine kinase/response regulator CckA